MQLFNTVHPKGAGIVESVTNYDERQIENETQYFQASPKFIMRDMRYNKAALDVLYHLREVLDQDDFDALRIDTKVHMLKPDWYPCIPGWHCDFVSRDEDGNIQPDEDDDQIRHFLVCSGGPVTQFIENRLVELSMETPSWQECDRTLNKLVHRGSLRLWQPEPGQILEFNAQELHRGMPARYSTWRWFFRASLFPKGDPRRREFQNKVRTQQQVYLELSTGW